MTTQEFIANSLRCYKAESIFIDKLCDNFPSFDLDEDDVLSFDFGLAKVNRGLGNHLIMCLYEKIIAHYVEEGLDEDKFDANVDSYCSTLCYDGKIINTEDDLDCILEEINEEV